MMGLDQAGADLTVVLWGAARPGLLVPQLDADLAGQPLDGFGERELVVLLDERDDVAPLAAAEAVPHAAKRGDVERRRLLVVERAQPLQRAAAGTLEGEVLAHDLVDARPLANRCDVLVTDPPGHPWSLRSPAVDAVPGRWVLHRTRADGCGAGSPVDRPSRFEVDRRPRFGSIVPPASVRSSPPASRSIVAPASLGTPGCSANRAEPDVLGPLQRA